MKSVKPRGGLLAHRHAELLLQLLHCLGILGGGGANGLSDGARLGEDEVHQLFEDTGLGVMLLLAVVQHREEELLGLLGRDGLVVRARLRGRRRLCLRSRLWGGHLLGRGSRLGLLRFVAHGT
jgi:hypothetical protein